jgi:hypothetical protein
MIDHMRYLIYIERKDIKKRWDRKKGYKKMMGFNI